MSMSRKDSPGDYCRPIVTARKPAPVSTLLLVYACALLLASLAGAVWGWFHAG